MFCICFFILFYKQQQNNFWGNNFPPSFAICLFYLHLCVHSRQACLASPAFHALIMLSCSPSLHVFMTVFLLLHVELSMCVESLLFYTFLNFLYLDTFTYTSFNNLLNCLDGSFLIHWFIRNANRQLFFKPCCDFRLDHLLIRRRDGFFLIEKPLLALLIKLSCGYSNRTLHTSLKVLLVHIMIHWKNLHNIIRYAWVLLFIFLCIFNVCK